VAQRDRPVCKNLTTVGVGKGTSWVDELPSKLPTQSSLARRLSWRFIGLSSGGPPQPNRHRPEAKAATPSLASLTPCFYGARESRASAFHAVSSRMHDVVRERHEFPPIDVMLDFAGNINTTFSS